VGRSLLERRRLYGRHAKDECQPPPRGLRQHRVIQR